MSVVVSIVAKVGQGLQLYLTQIFQNFQKQYFYQISVGGILYEPEVV